MADPTFEESGRALIMVIDDEIAIREAMNSLLIGWGYRVVTADSGVEILNYLLKNPSGQILSFAIIVCVAKRMAWMLFVRSNRISTKHYRPC